MTFLFLLPYASAAGIALSSLGRSEPGKPRHWMTTLRFPAVFFFLSAIVACLPKLLAVSVSHEFLIILGLLLVIGLGRLLVDGNMRREPAWGVFSLAAVIVFSSWAWKVRHWEQDIELARLNASFPGGRYLDRQDWPIRMSVMGFPHGEKALIREGIVEYGHGVEGTLMAILPYSLLGNAKSAVLLGFGEGEAWSAIRRLGLTTQIVEPLYALKIWSRYFVSEEPSWKAASWNRFLRTGTDRYDLIIADLPRPLDFSPSCDSLNMDFLANVRGRLNPGGIAAFWVPMPAFPVDIQQAAASFAAVFPHTAAWSYPEASGILLMGSVEPIDYGFQKKSSIPTDLITHEVQDFLRNQVGPQMKSWTEGWLPLALSKTSRPAADFSLGMSFMRWFTNDRMVFKASDLISPPASPH